MAKLQQAYLLDYQNDFKLSEEIHLKGPKLFDLEGNCVFTKLSMKVEREVNMKLRKENEILRESFNKMTKKLTTSLTLQ